MAGACPSSAACPLLSRALSNPAHTEFAHLQPVIIDLVFGPSRVQHVLYAWDSDGGFGNISSYYDEALISFYGLKNPILLFWTQLREEWKNFDFEILSATFLQVFRLVTKFLLIITFIFNFLIFFLTLISHGRPSFFVT